MRKFTDKTCLACQNIYTPTGSKQKICSVCSSSYWRARDTKQARERIRKQKQRAIEYLGDICNSCGCMYHPSQYEFHHLDPSIKEKDPASACQMSWENFKKELDKCELLCANCHRLKHYEYEVSK